MSYFKLRKNCSGNNLNGSKISPNNRSSDVVPESKEVTMQRTMTHSLTNPMIIDSKTVKGADKQSVMEHHRSP